MVEEGAMGFGPNTVYVDKKFIMNRPAAGRPLSGSFPRKGRRMD
jgi:hypothetical protein